MSSDPRYTIFAARAVFDTRLTPADVRILAALGTWSDKQGWCWPKQGTIAEKTGISRQRVNEGIKRLAELGYLQATEHVTERGQQASLYRVLLDMTAPEAVMEAAHGKAEIVEIAAVASDDSRLSPQTTPRDLVSAEAQQTQDAVPAVASDDSRVSPPGDSHIKKNIPISSKEKNKRASRLPPDWAPKPREVAQGVEGGLSEAEVYAAADHMRDWAASSPKAVKLDWDATFRNWLRTTISDAKRGRRPVVSGADDAERKRRLWVLETYGEWRSEWGPRPDLSKAQGGNP